jgi:hypothetical protein
MTHLAQVTLISATTDSADNQSNGFYVSDSGIITAEFDAWNTAIKTFYDTAYSAGALRGMTQSGHIVKFYNISNPAPNYPVYETTFSLATNPAAVEMPQEVALAVSYKNNTNNTVLRARRRGRIYISGWTEAANSAGRPSSTAYQFLAQGYKDYCDDVNVIGGLTAVIYSRVQDITNNVEEVWCDNEWDTQRRRGGKSTTRQTYTVTP